MKGTRSYAAKWIIMGQVKEMKVQSGAAGLSSPQKIHGNQVLGVQFSFSFFSFDTLFDLEAKENAFKCSPSKEREAHGGEGTVQCFDEGSQV